MKKIGNGALPAGWPAADAIGTVVSFLNAPYFIKANETLVSFVPDLTAAARLYSGVYHPSSSNVRNIVFTSKSAKKTTETVDMAKATISLTSLTAFVRKTFREFEAADFKLLWAKPDGIHIETDDMLSLYLGPSDDRLLFYIESISKGFHAFTLAEALSDAGATGEYPITDNSKFPIAAYDDDDDVIKPYLEHAFVDAKWRRDLYGPIENAQSETTVRELIGPILVAAAKIATDIKLVCEKPIMGSRGNGPVDYAAVYKDYNVVITEAKKNDVTSGLGQNIAQIKAGREDYLRRVLGKRKIEDTAFDITTVPCFGAVSTAEKWVFTLLSGRTVYCSRAFAVIFSCSDAELRSSMYDVIRQVVGILQAQKGAVDANEFMRKRGRIDDDDYDVE